MGRTKQAVSNTIAETKAADTKYQEAHTNIEGFLEEVCTIMALLLLHKHHHLKALIQPLAIIKKLSPGS